MKLQGQKSLALDTAIGMWQLLFAEKQWPFVDHWCQFLQVVRIFFISFYNYTRWFVAHHVRQWSLCMIFQIIIDETYIFIASIYVSLAVILDFCKH